MTSFRSAAPPTPFPKLICLSGLDPSGGAGLQADIETVAALGGHVQGLITALTVQDSRNLRSMQAVDAELLAAQLDCLLADARPQAVKFGLLGAAAQLPVIATALRPLALPAVCDPVLRAGGGTDFDSAGFVPLLRRDLFPWITVLTPNAAEARRLVPEARTLDDCARSLLDDGVAHVLITGGDEPDSEVINRWYSVGAAPQVFRWPRLAGPFHGAGCTLAAAIACRLAFGDDVGVALESAQAWTQQALAGAFAIGNGRLIPQRRASLARPLERSDEPAVHVTTASGP